MVTILLFALFFVLPCALIALVTWRVHLPEQREKHTERIHTSALVMQLDPRYQTKVENDRRYDLASRELRLKEWQAFTQLPVAQYGVLVREHPTAQWSHIAPVHKPLQLKPGESEQAAAVPASCLFSSVLASFHPTPDALLLGYLPGEQPVLASADGLCHVALAGATGNGKSVLVRLLMSQLCFIGASVLLLNPHYTRYDLRSREDWTPFEPYLHDDPMKCRDYRVIAHYLQMAAQEMLPARLEKYARSQPVGTPFYIVLDELPAIVKHIPEAPGYMADLLREGRKVGLFLVTAAQDFLVKTIMGNEGGAVRDCFRTAVYVGGDPTTARTLLDVRGTVDDGGLGKGVVMLRSGQVKQAALARVPYVDNEALYALLGPSTYAPVGTSDVTERNADGEPTQHTFDERNTVEADRPESGIPANISTFPKSALRPDGEPTQRDSVERNKYQFTDEEITAFKVAYRAAGSIDKALSAMGKGTHYREAARRVVKVYGLREEA